MNYRIGIDIGGTKVAVGLVDNHAKLICSSEFPTRKDAEQKLDPQEFARRIYDNTLKWLNDINISLNNIDSIGVGVPGTVDPINGIILYANNLEFEKVPFVTLLEEHFNLPIAMENDANVAAWAEYMVGAAKDDRPESMIMMTLGTGVGAGFIFHEALFSGVNQGAGEVGHMVIDYKGRPCNCGRQGCFENYASSAALIEDAKKAMKNDSTSLLWKLCPEIDKLNGKDFFEAVRQDDETAKGVFDEYMTYLSVGVLNLINSLQPDLFVIGGGISQTKDMLLNPLRDIVAKKVYTRGHEAQTKIVAAKLGNEAGILGAALLIEALD